MFTWTANKTGGQQNPDCVSKMSQDKKFVHWLKSNVYDDWYNPDVG